MTDAANSALPADDPARKLTVAGRDSPGVRHVALVGDTYSILVSGADTAGAYCLIDMSVPNGGGPPPHRHDYEESFTLLEGELQFAFRGEVHDGARRIDGEHPGQRAARVQERVRRAGADAVPVRPRRARRVLSRSRRSAANPRVAAAPPRPGADEGADRENRRARAEISHGAARPLIALKGGL